MDMAVANGLAAVVNFVFNMIQLLIFASIITSFIGDRSNPVVQVIESIVEPMYAPFRKITRHIPGPIDWSPMILLAIIIFIEKTLTFYLRSLALGQ